MTIVPRLRPRVIHVYASGGAFHLQAALEKLVGLLLEGRLQAGLVAGPWRARGVILGLYQAYEPAPMPAFRRMTGGPGVPVEPGDTYTGLVFASRSLPEAVEVMEGLAGCLGSRPLGATRVGPRRLAAGVVEVLGGHGVGEAVECASRLLGGPRARPLDPGSLGDLRGLARAYSEARWIQYPGALGLPRAASRARGPWRVRVGVELVEDRFIGEARIDGVFLAAPPAEPFSTLAGITGMPVGDQVLMGLEARFTRAIELYGVDARDIVGAAAEALGLDYE